MNMEAKSCTPGHLHGKRKLSSGSSLDCPIEGASSERALFVLRWIERPHSVAVNFEEIDCVNAPFSMGINGNQSFLTTAMPASIPSLVESLRRLEAKLRPSDKIVEAVSYIVPQTMKMENTAKRTTCKIAKISRKGVPRRRAHPVVGLPLEKQRIPLDKVSVAVTLPNNQQSSLEKGSNGNNGRISYKRHAREMSIMRAYKLEMRYVLGRIFNNLAELATRDGLVAQLEEEAPYWSVMGQVGNAFRESRGPTKKIRSDASSESLGGVVSGECSSQLVEHNNCEARVSKCTTTVFSHVVLEKADCWKVGDGYPSCSAKKELSQEDYSGTSTVAELSYPALCTKKVVDSVPYPQAENNLLKLFSCKKEPGENLNLNEGLQSHGQLLAVTIPSSMCSEGDSVEPCTPEVGLTNSELGVLAVTAALRESASVSMEEAVEELATSGLIPNIDMGKGGVLGGEGLHFGHGNQEKSCVASVEQCCSPKESAQKKKLWSSSKALKQSSGGAKVNHTLTNVERQGDGDGEIVTKGARRKKKGHVAVPQSVEQQCGLPSTSSSVADHSDIVLDDRLNDRSFMNGWQIGGEIKNPEHQHPRRRRAVGPRSVAVTRRGRIGLEDTKMLHFRKDLEVVTNSQLDVSEIKRGKHSRRNHWARIASSSEEAVKHSNEVDCLDIVTTAKVEICTVDELSRPGRSQRNRSAPFWLVRDNIVAPLVSGRGPLFPFVDPELVSSE